MRTRTAAVFQCGRAGGGGSAAWLVLPVSGYEGGPVMRRPLSSGSDDAIVLSRHNVAVNTIRLYLNIMYSRRVPKLWTETIEEHRRAVHDATLDTTAALVHEHGLAAVTMSQIAVAAGIGRATLYKYFPDVEAILVAFALIQHQHHDTELPVALLHRGEHVARARRQLQDLVSELLAESAGAG